MLGAEVPDQHLKSNQMCINRRDKLKLGCLQNPAVIQCSEQKATRLTTGSDRSICRRKARAACMRGWLNQTNRAIRQICLLVPRFL